MRFVVPVSVIFLLVTSMSISAAPHALPQTYPEIEQRSPGLLGPWGTLFKGIVKGAKLLYKYEHRKHQIQNQIQGLNQRREVSDPLAEREQLLQVRRALKHFEQEVDEYLAENEQELKELNIAYTQ